jgi:hypothetical protein
VSCKIKRGERRIPICQENSKSRIYERRVLADKTGLSCTMGDQHMLHTIHALDLGCVRIYPVYQLLYTPGGKSFLVLGAQIAPQIDAPVLVVFAPPIEIDVETRL